MTDLTGKLISGTYKQLLLVNSSTTNTGVQASAAYVQSGDGTNTALKVSRSGINVVGTGQITSDLSVNGGLAVGDKVCASAFFGDGSNLSGITASIGGDVSVSSLTVAGDGNFGGSVVVKGNTSVSGNIDTAGNTSIGGTLTATGATQLGSTVTVVGKAVFEGDVSVSGSLIVTGKQKYFL